MDCNICCQTITKTVRKEIKCPYCEFTCCITCFKKYLLESPNTADCMNCHKELSLDFIAETTPKTFHNNEYRKKRVNNLLSKEMSLLPDSQHLVEREKIKRSYEEKLILLSQQEKEYRRLLRNTTDEIKILRNKLAIIKHSNFIPERKKFIMGCPVQDCRGFLSTAYKCGTCDTYVCSKCNAVKTGRDDETHECNPESVASANLIKKETKPCPSCAAPIFKISGCFAPDTPILLWNGSVKMSQNIIIGDELIGDDGTKRTVTNLTSGTDIMYTITQKHADTYVVNSKHTLSLVFSGNRTVTRYGDGWKVKWFCMKTLASKIKKFTTENEAYTFSSTISEQNIFDLTIEEFLKLPESTRKNFKGIRCSDVKWEYQNILIDPYILGMWLGDGYSNGKEFASNDTELIEIWKKWAEENDSEVVKTINKYRYYVRRRTTSIEKSNPLKKCLLHYNLINNKHIPLEYLRNSRQVRLKLLAGLIDTDGCVRNNGRRIVITQVNRILSEQIIYLTRSLGFLCSYRICSRKNISIFGGKPKNYQDIYQINISGQYINEIPTVLKRKHCVTQKGGVNLLLTGIDIKKNCEGNYFGWSVDGNKRFLLGDFTIGHNCSQMFCTECHTAFDWNTGLIETKNIHNPHFYEWQRQNNNGVAPRVPGDDPCGFNNNIPSFRLITKTLSERGQVFKHSSNSHRALVHAYMVLINMFPAQVGVAQNTDLRVKYLMKEIDEDTWFKTLKIRQKKAEKDHDVHQVLEMFIATFRDIFNTFIEGQILNLESTVEELRSYVNKQLQIIERRYNNKTPYLLDNWEWV